MKKKIKKNLNTEKKSTIKKESIKNPIKPKKILSIVIPAYNMEKYIAQTLDTLICDEYMQDLEVLIIDDGSKDSTADIAKVYADKYPDTFILVRKPNGGHGSVLNKGIEMATGKYFRPLDADDWVSTDSLKSVIKELKKEDADMVLTNFVKVLEQSNKEIKIRIRNVWNMKEIKEGRAIPKPGRKQLVYGRVYDFNEELFDYSPQYLFHHVMYRTQLLRDNNVRFDEHVFYDDMEYDIFPLIYVKTVLPIDRYLYYYRLEREGQSVDESSFARNNKHRRLIVENITRFYVEHKNQFGANVYNYINDDILWKIRRQYEIYFNICHNNKEIANEILGFADTIKNIDEDIYNKTTRKSVEILKNVNSIFYPLILSKTLHKITYKLSHLHAPNREAGAWTMESDKYMHRLIRFRRLLAFFHLSWLNKDMMKIKRFKNIHKGERCFITCPGPSMTIKDLEKLENEYTIGVNSITKAYPHTKWRPTYYSMIDYFAFEKQVENTPVDGGVWCKREAFFHYRFNPISRNGNETFMLINYKNHLKQWVDKHKVKYSSDLAVCAYDGFTVTNFAIQLAMYMGFKKIYIIGADCDYTKPQIHFIECEDDKKKFAAGWLPQATELSINGYKAIREFAYANGCEIYNVTRGGKLESFYRDDFDRVLASK